MVGVAQVVECQTVDLVAVGSNPITHPSSPVSREPAMQDIAGPLAQLAEQQTLNLRVAGSMPARLISSRSWRQGGRLPP